jgi:signal transduction histidine kinase
LYPYACLFWTAAATLLSVGGKQQKRRALCAQIAGDIIMVFFTILLLRGAQEAAVAFAICVGVIAATIGVQRKVTLAVMAAGAFLLLFRDLTPPLSEIPAPQVTDNWSLGITKIMPHMILLLALFMFAAVASRSYRLKLFNDKFSSPHILAFGKSFEFDLQAWTNASASLFRPEKAACLVQNPERPAIGQHHACNLPMLQNEKERQELLDALLSLQIGYRLFDTHLNRIIFPDTGHYKAFDKNEQRIARVLRRADIKAALVQPLQIDSMRGGFICAVNNHIDAIIMAEASFLGHHVTEMTAYLGRIASSQRNFIADAHEVARRDMHDGVLQTLAALRMRLLLLTKRADVVRKPIELEIRKTVDIVTLEQSRLRGFLESSERADHRVDLVKQINICARTISLQWGIDVTFKSDVPNILVDIETSFNIEHLLREVITNAVRHAKSKSLTVRLSLKQDALIISVTDLDQRPEGPQMHEKPALTLKSASLRERLRLLNGEAYVEGQGSGAMLSIRIPMQQVEND